MTRAPDSPAASARARLVHHAALLLVSVLFGVNYLASKHVLAAVPPEAWAFYRIALATLLLAPIVALLRRPWPALRRWPALLVAAFLGVAANQVMFAEGIRRTTPAHAAIINTTIPVLTLCFAVLARQERFRLRKVVAIVVAMTGVLVLLRVDHWGSGASVEDTLAGDLLTLGNAASFSLFLVWMRAVARDLDAMTATVCCFAAGTVMVWMYGHASLSEETLQAALAPDVWPVALFVVVGATVVTYLLNNWALRAVDSSMVALYIYVQPVVATTLSIALGLDAPETRFWVASALVCAGLFIEQTRRPRAPAKAVRTP